MKKLIGRFLIWAFVFIVLDIVIIGTLILGIEKVFANPLCLLEVITEQNLLKKFIDYQGLFILMAALVIVYFQKSNNDDYSKTTYGSSRWAKSEEIRAVLNSDKGIILGKKLCLDMNSPLNKNIAVIGSSGAGKSRGFIKPNVLQMNGSYVITDPKGEIFDDTSEYLKSNGYSIKVLNLVNPNASDLYNPLAYIKEDRDIQILSKTIIDNTSSGSTILGEDGFWANSEIALLTALINYVISERPEKQRNLSSVLQLLLAAAKGDKLDELFLRLSDNHKALTSYKIFCLSGEPKTRGNIMIGLGVRLQTLQNETISRLTSGDTLELCSIGERKTAVYVITSDSHRTYDFIASMFFSQLFQTLYYQADLTGGGLTVPVVCLLDEFSNIGKIPDFSSKVASMRSRGISVSLVLQSLGQLKAKYEKEWSNILGNCDTLLFLGTQDIETARFISERMGKATVMNKTRSYSIPLGNSARGSKGENEGKAGRPLLTPDEVTRLRPAKSIIFVQGLYPILTEKYNLIHHQAYQQPKKAGHNQYSPVYLPDYDIFKPVFEEIAPEEQKQTVKNPKVNSKKKTTKEETFFDNLRIFENADFGRCRDERGEIYK